VKLQDLEKIHEIILEAYKAECPESPYQRALLAVAETQPLIQLTNKDKATVGGDP
jgi:hypothetical protein